MAGSRTVVPRGHWQWHGRRLCTKGESPGKSTRFQGPATDALDARQAQVLAEIEATRTTGVRGPFAPWLANPELAAAAQQLGRICRYETSLPLRESELVILEVAQHHRCKTEWAIHVEEARRAGLEEPLIDAIEARKPLDIDVDVGVGANPGRDHALRRFAREVLTSSHASDEAYAGMRAAGFSDAATVETVAIVGYYSFVALTLNVFEIEP